MAERYVSFRIGKETSLGSEVVPTENKNPFTDGTLIFAYNNKYNHNDISEQIVDGRLYVDATIDNNNYRFPVNSECSYFLINKEDGKDFEMGNTGRPVYFSGGVPQPVDYISTAYGGTGLKSFNANRMVWASSTSALSTSGHYVDADHFAVNSETLPSYNFYVNGTSGFGDGHLYLTGAKESSSVNNTTQIVFGTSSNNHVAVSSITNALIINPNTTETINQIVLYLNQQSRFPSGITCGDDDTIGNINTNGDLIASGGLSVDGTTSLGSNLNVAGSTAMQGNITITNENPYVKFIDSSEIGKNQVYYIQGYQGKFAFGPTFANAVQIDASGNMTLPSGATITPRAGNTGSIGTSSYEWNEGYFRSVKSGDTLQITPSSTLYLDSGSGASLIFRPQGTEKARFDTSSNFLIKTTTYAYNMLPAATNTYALGNSSYCWGTAYLGTTYTYHVYPRTTNTYNLGSSSLKWSNVYAGIFDGTHKGNILGVTETEPTSATRYSPLFIATGGAAASSTTEYARRANADFNICTLQGTTSANGYMILELGNSTASGTAGNKYGVTRLYSAASSYVDVRANNVTTYGGLQVSGYAKGGYEGIQLGNSTSYMTIMSSDTHQGLYNESNSRWLFYYNKTYDHMSIGYAETSDSSFVLTVKGNTYLNGTNYSGNLYTYHIYPQSSASYNLGSTSAVWATGYMKRLHLYGTTDATMTAGSTNPGITFSESGSQPVHLIYTDYDSYRSPAGLKVIGGTSATPAWFEVEGAMYAGGYITSTVSGARFKANNGSRVTWFGSSVNGNYQGIYDETAGYYLIRNTDSSHTSNGVYLGATTTVAGSVTLSGQVYRGGVSTSWINGRAGALVRTTTINGYSATASIKTTNGSWEIGAYDNSSYTDRLIFTYCTDANYNAGTNTTTAQVYMTSGGLFSCTVLKSSNYGTGTPGSSTAGYGTNGALYFKVIS